MSEFTHVWFDEALDLKIADVARVTYSELIAKKEAAVCGWIVYVALATGDGPSVETMRALFGPWLWRSPRVEFRQHQWFLVS